MKQKKNNRKIIYLNIAFSVRRKIKLRTDLKKDNFEVV